jgi:hypothetical protein
MQLGCQASFAIRVPYTICLLGFSVLREIVSPSKPGQVNAFPRTIVSASFLHRSDVPTNHPVPPPPGRHISPSTAAAMPHPHTRLGGLAVRHPTDPDAPPALPALPHTLTSRLRRPPEAPGSVTGRPAPRSAAPAGRVPLSAGGSAAPAGPRTALSGWHPPQPHYGPRSGVRHLTPRRPPVTPYADHSRLPHTGDSRLRRTPITRGVAVLRRLLRAERRLLSRPDAAGSRGRTTPRCVRPRTTASSARTPAPTGSRG